ncbi:MAG: 3-deoxy-7-phosphoheptulonate synthase [Thermoguttaceae bacterium]
MIIFIRQTASAKHIQSVIDALKENGIFGYKTEFDGSVVIVSAEGLAGSHPNSPTLKTQLEEFEAVEKIVAVSEPYQLVSHKIRDARSEIKTGILSVGNGTFGIIAGPCTVESEKQTVETAIAVRKAGASGLRGGAFKPRTSPYAFQGLKEEGLKILAKARKETGLAVVTEVMCPEEVPLVAEYADVLQIGTRNAQNFRLLEAVGKIRKPILLKRGYSCTLDEFLMSAEYILAGGNQQVILCERGIRTFETFTRFTLSLAIVPELRSKTHLPIIVDPSHAAGKETVVAPMAAAAAAAGADGLLVEVHPDPQHALCDGRQSLTFNEFEEMVKTCNQIAAIVQK